MATSTGSEAHDRMVERLGGTADPRKRYEYVLWLAKKLPSSARWSFKTEELRGASGCVSQVFVRGELGRGPCCAGRGTRMRLITKGLLALLIEGTDWI